MSREEFIQNILDIDNAGRIKSRERNDLEFKESYGEKSWIKYAKTMAAFANNNGGYIIFGIKNSPREIIGISDSFNEFKQEDFTAYLNSLFSPELLWETGIVDVANKKVGYLYTEKSDEKPVIALKNESKEKININAGDVFYRYRARSEKIKYPEMRRIIDERAERERERLLKLIETIRKSNTTNIGIVDYDKGLFTTPMGVDIAIERKLVLQVLRKAKFIKEGSFNEIDGQPVLKVTGNINVAEEIPVPNIEPDVQYPYIQKQIAENLGVKPQVVHAMIWKYKMKSVKKFHMEVTISSNSSQKTHKFSDIAVQFLADKINENKDNPKFINGIIEEYNQSRRFCDEQ